MSTLVNRVNVFTYGDDIIDLSRVSVINADEEGRITFYFQDDWEYSIEVDGTAEEIKIIKKQLIEKFNLTKCI